MGIRLTIVLAILPVFAALGILSAGIEYLLIKEEITWGMEEENRTIALGIAAFIDSDPSRIENIPKLLSQKSVSNIEILDPSNDAIIKSFGKNFSASPVISSTYPVHGLNGGIVSKIRVNNDAAALNAELLALSNSLILRIVLLAALSLPVGWIFGTVLIRKIQSSNTRANQILFNPAPLPLKTTKIRELDEVNEMLEILAALLEERRVYSRKREEESRP